MQEHGQLIIVAAPSGAGKTSLVRAVVKKMPDVVVSISHTTRQPRDGEINGIHYHFVDPFQFRTMIQDQTLLEYAQVHNEFYGTSKHFVQRNLMAGRDVILEIDCQGAFQVKQEHPDALLIFILPPSIQALHDRLKKRGKDSDAVIMGRLEVAKKELSCATDFDYLVINDDFDYATLALCSIIQAGHLRVIFQKKVHHTLLTQLTGKEIDV